MSELYQPGVTHADVLAKCLKSLSLATLLLLPAPIVDVSSQMSNNAPDLVCPRISFRFQLTKLGTP